MICPFIASGHSARRRGVLAVAMLLAGCAAPAGPSTTAAPPAAAVAAPQDPLGQFLGAAGPGQEGRVVLADGRSTDMRVLRAYTAASGRECREVLVGGPTGRASLFCRAEGHWAPVRPLLGQGGALP